MTSSRSWIIGGYATLALTAPEPAPAELFADVTDRVRPHEAVWLRQKPAWTIMGS